jgi:hypothetical protein
MSDKLVDATRDAIALTAAAEREDRASVELMLATYANATDEERGQLLGAMLACNVAVVRFAAEVIGADPGKIIAAVAMSLRDG